MWDLPGLGLKPVSPALAGGFLTTAPPGKPQLHSFACGYPVVPAPVVYLFGYPDVPFVEKTITFPLNRLGIFIEIS